jgi:hypothetical protein
MLYPCLADIIFRSVIIWVDAPPLYLALHLNRVDNDFVSEKLLLLFTVWM